jgi:hypothetical protein
VPEFWYLVATAVLAAPLVFAVLFSFYMFVSPGPVK